MIPTCARRTPATLLRLPLLAVVCLSLTACSSLIPKPPEYTGADSVDAVPAEAFVGRWRMVALNPVDDSEVPERELTYEADGTFTGMIQPTADMIAAMGDEPILLDGTWSVSEGYLVHDTSEVKLPGDGLLSRMTAMMTGSRSLVASRANVYERTRDRIVLVTDEGYANAFERL